MLSKLALRFGSNAGAPPLEFAPGAMTVFVGPNNSGKSRALVEIEYGVAHDDSLIISAVEESGPGRTERLDGTNRLTLLNPDRSENLNAPHGLLGRLLVENERRERVRAAIHSAFGVHLVIDFRAMQSFEAKLSTKPPTLAIEHSIGEDAREFFRAARPLETYSDGVRAFAGIVAALTAAELRLILIDEPEAFLHPPLSRKLGRFVAELARERDGNVIAATHSADFLFGAITSGVPVNIVRLTWDGEHATARLMPSSEIETITRNPFMRTARVLDAVFHRGAIVCEADADRAFYDEINARLLAAGEGAADVLFLNANGKDSLARIAGPLRKLGIPAAAIADLDLIEEGAFAELLDACNVPPASANALTTLRAQVRQRFQVTGQRAKSGGLASLTSTAKAEAQDLLDQLAAYGIFLVPVGELERWLGLVQPSKGAWLQRVFDAMKSDPSDPEYVRPHAGDVWNFMRGVTAWIEDANRRGMP